MDILLSVTFPSFFPFSCSLSFAFFPLRFHIPSKGSPQNARKGRGQRAKAKERRKRKDKTQNEKMKRFVVVFPFLRRLCLLGRYAWFYNLLFVIHLFILRPSSFPLLLLNQAREAERKGVGNTRRIRRRNRKTEQ